MTPRAAPRVLVVDDGRVFADLLRELLTPLGYSVTLAATGQEALDQVARFDPDVVLLDLTLPGMTGEEVLDTLRQMHPRIPVVAMTGDADRGPRALARGAVAYLPKPFDLQRVEETLRAVLGEHGR